MTVPKATMNKYDRFVPGKNQIGTARQVSNMQPEAKTFTENSSPNNQLRLCFFPADPSHHPAACRLVDDINHQMSGSHCKIRE